MKKIQFIKTRYKLLSLGALCLGMGAMGSFTVVNASIPAADGIIHGCRNTTTTLLRVIDNATQSCDSNETNLNWDQKGVKGYAHLVFSSNTYSLDTNRSYGFSNLQSALFSHPKFDICMTVAGTPKNISVEKDGVASNIDGVGIKDESGWTNSTSAGVCNTLNPTANVHVRASSNLFVTIF